MKKFILRALFTLAVITAATNSIGFVNYSSAAVAAVGGGESYPDGTGGIWNSQVITYLNAMDYSFVNVYYIDANGNRYCTSRNHPGFHTIVFVNGGAIVGHEDIPDGYDG